MAGIAVGRLHDRFGATVFGVDLCTVTESHLYPEIRAAFEEHSLLLFRDQRLDEESHIRLATLFGPLENREQVAGNSEPFSISAVSNVTDDGSLLAPDALTLIDLTANMLWHTDSTFLPVPALVNLLAAAIVPSSGGQTEFCTTRAAFDDLSSDRQAELRELFAVHQLTHSREQVDPRLTELHYVSRWPDRAWRTVWRNPSNGREAIYIASHAYTIEGMDRADGERFVRELLDHCTQPVYRYSHDWTVGDVILWDERAVLHRGRPWPYDEPRTLNSICCSVTEADGLSSVSPPAGP
jgi:alpha-ketoglutarate-dependent 2,4-dichlorophenoxyacetate dioxygenase